MNILRSFPGILTGLLTALTSLAYLPRVASAQPAACPIQSNKRVALVIGNSYSGAEQVSGREDARVMSAYLCQIGFSVVTVLDGNLKEMTDAINALRLRIAGAETVVFFYSGHGYQLDNVNYLVPFEFTAIDPTNPQVSMQTVFTSLGGAPDEAVKLILLDACRSSVKLPVIGGRTLKDLPLWKPGLSEPTQPPTTAFGFATDYGQTAESGPPDGFSPYSSALLRSIREPGLEIRQLFKRVHREVLKGTGDYQSTQEKGLGSLPAEFYLRAPVLAHAELGNVNGDLLVLVNGDVVLNSNQGTRSTFPLKAGENELLLLMSKEKSYHNTHSWDVTEGWGYSMKIGFQAAGEVSCSGIDPSGYCFSDEEHHPFKDGPHHGGAFVVAKAILLVDGDEEPPRVTLKDPDTDIWNREAPFWARDQELLFEQSVTSLSLTPDDVLGGLSLQPPWDVLLRPVVQEFLSSGKLLGHKIADPSQTYATVWGNRVFRNAVEICMTQPAEREARIRDLKASIAAIFARHPKPFRGFDLGLMECLRRVEQGSGSGLRDEDIRIWTAIRDRSQS